MSGKRKVRSVVEQLDAQMKAWQREPRFGRIPREALSVAEYRQPQRIGYRLKAGFNMLRGGE